MISRAGSLVQIPVASEGYDNGVRFGRPQIVDAARIRLMGDEGFAVLEISRRMSFYRQSVYNALKENVGCRGSRRHRRKDDL